MVKSATFELISCTGLKESGPIRDSIRFGGAAADTKAQDSYPVEMLIVELATSPLFDMRGELLASYPSDYRGGFMPITGNLSRLWAFFRWAGIYILTPSSMWIAATVC